MLEIGPRLRIKKELINRNGHVIKLFKCDLLIFSLSEILDRFLASWTLGLTQSQRTQSPQCVRFNWNRMCTLYLVEIRFG